MVYKQKLLKAIEQDFLALQEFAHTKMFGDKNLVLGEEFEYLISGDIQEEFSQKMNSIRDLILVANNVTEEQLSDGVLTQTGVSSYEELNKKLGDKDAREKLLSNRDQYRSATFDGKQKPVDEDEKLIPCSTSTEEDAKQRHDDALKTLLAKIGVTE